MQIPTLNIKNAFLKFREKFGKKYKNTNFDSKKFWESRYRSGENSGDGSYGKLAEFKANVINEFLILKYLEINTTIELGCGDGNQISYIKYKNYLGLDVSKTAVEICKRKFAGDNSKNFTLMSEVGEKIFDLGVSLDVIYHLVEDQVYFDYMEKLFNLSDKYVIIYSSNTEILGNGHVRHRNFSNWIKVYKPDWILVEKVENPFSTLKNINLEITSSADFFFYKNSKHVTRSQESLGLKSLS
jgi:SAM-dependent methyltransferase